LKAIPPVKAMMTPFPYWVDIDDTLNRALEMMAEHAIHHMPVVEDGRLVSVLSQKDLHGVPKDRGKLRVRDVCRGREAYVVGLSEPLDRVLFHMAEHGLDSALVVKDGRLAGIFTVSDACRHFGRLLRSLFPPGGDDAA
jgi:acetoin utilization protein AcuB